MNFRDTLSSMGMGKSHDTVLRKITYENKNKNKEPLYFEVGKQASRYNEQLGVISAILFEEQKSDKLNDLIHSVYIRKPNGEEYIWKQLYRDRVIEFDIDLD